MVPNNRNLKFFKKSSIIAQFKALINERISEWAHFLNLGKWFHIYLHFSVPKKGFLWIRVKRELHTWSGTQVQNF